MEAKFNRFLLLREASLPRRVLSSFRDTLLPMKRQLAVLAMALAFAAAVIQNLKQPKKRMTDIPGNSFLRFGKWSRRGTLKLSIEWASS